MSSHLLSSSFLVSPLDHGKVMQRGNSFTSGFGVPTNSCDCTLRAGELHVNVLSCSHQMLICKQSGVSLHSLTQQHLVVLQARCLQRCMHALMWIMTNRCSAKTSVNQQLQKHSIDLALIPTSLKLHRPRSLFRKHLTETSGHNQSNQLAMTGQ